MALSQHRQLTATSSTICEGQLISQLDQAIDAELYIRVCNVLASKNICEIKVELKGDALELVRTYQFDADLTDESANHIKQAYLHLKTLPEFADAIDC